MIKYEQKLSPQYQEAVFTMLAAADEEFVPPLSKRASTLQQSFEATQSCCGVQEYYEKMLAQEFILATNGSETEGFLTFIKDYCLNINGKEYECDYVTTIIVAKAHRGSGIAEKLYRAFFDIRKGSCFATRTWSTNYAHLHLLKELGFGEIATLKDDRGIGIDTIYFLKTVCD